MAEISGTIALNKFVDKLLFKSGKTTDFKARYLQIAIDGLRDLLMHNMNYITVAKVSPDADTNTIDFPSDCVEVIDVSYPDDGRMLTLVRDDSMVTTISTDDEGDEYLDSDDGEGVGLNEEFVYDGYGARGGYSEWYFTIDKKLRRIHVAGAFSDHFILRYISSGINTGAETYIPLYAEESLEAYVRWKESDYADARGDVIEQKRQGYNRAIRRMKKLTSVGLQEIVDAIYKSANQSIRR